MYNEASEVFKDMHWLEGSVLTTYVFIKINLMNFSLSLTVQTTWSNTLLRIISASCLQNKTLTSWENIAECESYCWCDYIPFHRFCKLIQKSDKKEMQAEA